MCLRIMLLFLRTLPLILDAQRIEIRVSMSVFLNAYIHCFRWLWSRLREHVKLCAQFYFNAYRLRSSDLAIRSSAQISRMHKEKKNKKKKSLSC
jgi:hypothetical protein